MSDPIDNDEADPTCPRCGGGMMWEECTNCGGEGCYQSDDDPEEDIPCDVCDGRGGMWACGNPLAWCDAHILPGKEKESRFA